MARFEGLRRWFRIPRQPDEGAALDVDAEVRFHLGERIRELGAAGVPAEEARARAEREFGDVERLRRTLVPVAAGTARRVRRRQWWDDIGRDIAYGWRKLVTSPGFTLVAVLTLAVGIGASTAIFSVVNSVLLRPLGWESPDRVVMVWENDRFSGTVREASSVPDYYDFRERNRSFEQLAFYATTDANMALGAGDPERVGMSVISHELLEVLGIEPLLGRGIEAGEDSPGGDRVALVSERFWRTRLGGDAAALGSGIRLNDSTYVVVGVMPAAMEFPDAGTAVWTSAQMGPTSLPRYNHPITVVGRLRAGVTVSGAQADMTRIAQQLEEEYPQANTGRGVFVEPILDVTFAGSRSALLVLLGGVLLLLVIACTNVASLLLARGFSRSREVAVRATLGAGGGRLVRQFLVESLMLTFVSAGLGVLVARLSLSGLVSLLPADTPRISLVSVDGRVLGLAILAATVIGVIFGLLPTLQARRLDVQAVLRSESDRGSSATRSRQMARSSLVVAEVAISFVLVIGAALLFRTVSALRAVDPGFRADNVLRMEFNLPATRYPQDFSIPIADRAQQRFYAELFERLDALPGIESFALASHHPLAQSFTNSFVIVGREAEAAGQSEIGMRGVSQDYARTLGVAVIAGREFDSRDRPESGQVIMISEAAARRYFPDQNAVGQHIAFWGASREIVGILGDQRFSGLAAEAPATVYVPLAQMPMNTGSLLARTVGDPMAAASSIRAAVRETDPELAVFDIATLDQTVLRSISRERSTMTLLVSFAVVALLLALIGVHGVLSYAVSQRRRELGVRLALGASRGNLLAMVVGQGLILAGAGVAIGLACALAGSRLLASLLFGVEPTDPVTFSAVTLLVLVIAAAASWVPARRALHMDPVVALRGD